MSPILKPSKSKSLGYQGKDRNADLISIFPILTCSPNVWIIEITLSNLELCTVVSFSSIK